MKLRLDRVFLKKDYTIGFLSVDGVYLCDTLEDPVRDFNKDGDLLDTGETKIYGNTAIPYGIYEVKLTYSPHFKRVLPILLDVKHFEGIRIHRGVNQKHTEGCILVGKNKIKGGLVDSAHWEKMVIALLKDAEDRKEKVFIEIV